ncbi:hypothetical protein T484DRAFT_1891469, partial [Baffinella frigidus]
MAWIRHRFYKAAQGCGTAGDPGKRGEACGSTDAWCFSPPVCIRDTKRVGGMGGKRSAQPSGDAQGKAAASGDDADAQGGASRKRQTWGLGVFGGAGSAEGGSCGQEESWSTLAPVTMRFPAPSTLTEPRVED